jgi:hypothetical protein
MLSPSFCGDVFEHAEDLLDAAHVLIPCVFVLHTTPPYFREQQTAPPICSTRPTATCCATVPPRLHWAHIDVFTDNQDCCVRSGATGRKPRYAHSFFSSTFACTFSKRPLPGNPTLPLPTGLAEQIGAPLHLFTVSRRALRGEEALGVSVLGAAVRSAAESMRQMNAKRKLLKQRMAANTLAVPATFETATRKGRG